MVSVTDNLRKIFAEVAALAMLWFKYIFYMHNICFNKHNFEETFFFYTH